MNNRSDISKSARPLISIVTPTYNEAGNVLELYERIQSVIQDLEEQFCFEIIFIDNNSEDGTLESLRAVASENKSVKVIINTRNFGHIRSPFYGILQSSGVATVYLASDLQDPPELIPDFLKKWQAGYKIVLGTKPKAESSFVFHHLRKLYYRVLNRIAETKIIQDSTGFGVYDKVVIDQLRNLHEPYPFLRGLICELGWPVETIAFTQPRRKRGLTKNNLYTLYDIGILGLLSHSRLPLRFASFLGFFIGFSSFIVGLVFLVLKIFFWHAFPLGIAPALIGIFFLFGMLFLFIGLVGEYISIIHRRVQNLPLVIEKERINF